MHYEYKEVEDSQDEKEFSRKYNHKNTYILFSPNRQKKLIVGREYRQNKIHSTPITLFYNNEIDTVINLAYLGANDVQVNWINNNQILLQYDSIYNVEKKKNLIVIENENIIINHLHPKVKINLSVLKEKDINDSSTLLNEKNITIVIEYVNNIEEDIKVLKALILGHHRDFDNYIEAYDFEGNKIDVARDIQYQYGVESYLEYTILKPNESKKDTINLNTFYRFEKGKNYRLRFIDVLSLDKEIYSNWVID